MVEHVEGEWKSFTFRMAQLADHVNILGHLRSNFYRDEPLCKLSGYEDDMGDDFDIGVVEALKDNLTFLAIHKDDTNKVKIAGVCIITVTQKGQHPELGPVKLKKSLALLTMLQKCSDDANIFERYPDMDHYAELFMISVDKEFRGYGLATEIYDRSFKMLTAMKFQLIKSVFTSPYTQKVGRKTGFIELAQIMFREWKDENGGMHYPDANEDDCAITMVKELKF